MLEEKKLALTVSVTDDHCPIGETVGKRNMVEKKIPVLSCEGACIRGEIARVAANMVARQPEYSRACHGELFAVPDSAIARWVRSAEKVVMIDGCFLRCHGRIIENLLGKDQLVNFDALAVYKKYSDIFDPEEVPEMERNGVARQVAEHVMAGMKNGGVGNPDICCTAASCSLDKKSCCGR
jgi:uncharacterized metal-binding protein